jgi:hypothetical protein
MTTSFKSAGRITGTFLGVVLLGGVCFAQPAMTLSPAAGPPTTNLTVSGSGFVASAAVDIYFDTTNLALTVTNDSVAKSDEGREAGAPSGPPGNWSPGITSRS